MKSAILKCLIKVYNLFRSKHNAELKYWMRSWILDNKVFDHSNYENLFCHMAGEKDGSFVKDKVIADFGCGPRGSLTWAKLAKERIGIDILVDKYKKVFPQELERHNMLYICSSENSIPLPDNCVDILFTMNALDHVYHLKQMCDEMRRIVRPGGEIIGSFNLNNPPRPTEPNPLTEQLVKELLFKGWQIRSWRISALGKNEYLYQPLLEDRPIEPKGKPAFLWVRAIKP